MYYSTLIEDKNWKIETNIISKYHNQIIVFILLETSPFTNINSFEKEGAREGYVSDRAEPTRGNHWFLRIGSFPR